MTDHLADTNVGNIEYIRREDMLNAVETLDIIPSVDGMGIPTDAEDFRVQFLGTVLKVEPADVAPVVHARWIEDEGEGYHGIHCSRCRFSIPYGNVMMGYNFCPNCGAKMER